MQPFEMPAKSLFVVLFIFEYHCLLCELVDSLQLVLICSVMYVVAVTSPAILVF